MYLLTCGPTLSGEQIFGFTEILIDFNTHTIVLNPFLAINLGHLSFLSKAMGTPNGSFNPFLPIT